MPSTDASFDVYAEHIHTEFSESTAGLIKDINEALSAETPDQSIISCGPDIIVSQGGRHVRFTSIIINQELANKQHGYHEEILLFGHDPFGKIIGYRKLNLSERLHENALLAGGFTHIIPRNQGFTKFFEMAAQEIFYRAASIHNKPLEHMVVDSNMLGQAKAIAQESEAMKHFVSAPIEKLEKVRQEKDAEHKRWEKMWGEGGKLGYESEPGGILYTKWFQSKSDTQYAVPLNSIGEIHLTIGEEQYQSQSVLKPEFIQQTQRASVRHSKDLASIKTLLQSLARV